MNNPEELSRNNKIFIFIVCVCIATTAIFATIYKLQFDPQRNQETLSVTYLSAPELQQIMEHACKCIPIIDLRSPAEYMQGHINRSVNIAYHNSSFIMQMEEYNKTSPIILYTNDGAENKEIVKFLVAIGFRNVYILEEGFNTWVNYSYPIEK